MDASTQIEEMTIQDFWDHHSENRNLHLIDVRTPDEFGEVAAEPAVNFPLEDLDPESIAEQLGITHDTLVFFICRSGRRSRRAAEIFAAAGFEHVVNLQGGTLAWVEEGLPTR